MSYLKRLFLFGLILSSFAFSAKADDFAVEDVGGVPRITQNGKPIRTRMMYVSPTYFMLGSPSRREAYNYAAWNETFCEIPPLEKNFDNVSVRIDALKQPCEFRIAKLDIAEVESGKKIYSIDCVKKDERVKITTSDISTTSLAWEVFEKTNVITVKIPEKQQAYIDFSGVSFEAKKTYRIDIKFKSKNKIPYEIFTVHNGKFLEPKIRSQVGSQTKLAAQAGINIITFPVQSADFYNEDDAKPDFSRLKGAIDEIIAANPKVKILLRIRFYPPSWWMKKYKDDVMCEENGTPNTFVCPSSQRFREDSAKILKLVIEYCEKNYSNNMMGYHPGGGNSCEWFYGDSWGPKFYGYNKSAVDAWKKWASKKYKTDKELSAAWNDKSATLANIKPPSAQERSAAIQLLDPKAHRKLIDYNIFLQDEMVDMVEHLAKVIREQVPNRLSVLFYGYTFEFSTASSKGPSNTGHYALWRILASKNFDIISGPTSYRDRNLGEASLVMSAAESITRSGKIWFSEDDIRTHKVPQSQQNITSLGKELHTLDDTIQVLQRDLAQQAIRNLGCWWMDLAGTGWYNDPALWPLMKKFAAMENDMIKYPVKYEPEVAMIVDERSMYYVGAKSTAETCAIISSARVNLNRTGTPFGQYLFSDFILNRGIDPKLMIFPLEYAMTGKQRKYMYEKAKDAAAIFVWAPAYVEIEKNKETFSPKAVSEGTGFHVENISQENIPAEVTSTKLGEELGMPKVFGFKKSVAPLFAVFAEDGDKVLALYRNGEPAIVLRGKHLFCGISEIPIPLYQYMVKLSGAHVYADGMVSVYANGAYISVTCLDENTTPHNIRVDVNSDKEIFDALTGEKLGKGPMINLKMKRGDNRVLRLGSGNKEFTSYYNRARVYTERILSF